MQLKKGILFLLLVVFVEARPHTLTVNELVTIALKHSPDIDISRFDFKTAEARSQFAEGFYLPSLNLDVSAGKQQAKFPGQSTFTTDLMTGSLGASQLLYDFGKTAGRVEGSREDVLAQEAQLQQIISDKILDVKQSYYAVLKSKSIIDVQRKNVKLQEQQLHRAKKYLLSGIKTIIDVSDAEVQVEQAKLDLQNAEYALELERSKLEESLGFIPYEGNYVLYSKKLSLPYVSKKLPQVRTPFSQLESFAYVHRYVLESSKHIVRSARANVTSQKGDYAPTISLQGNYNKQYVDDSVAFSPENQGQVAVNMSWNLFSGYQTDASVQEAKIAVLKASSQVKRVKLAIKREVLDAHISVRRSKKNVELNEKITIASRKKFDQAQKRYENDLSDYVELQDAQQGYIQSLSNLVNAYYDYYIALAQLDNAIGK